MSGDTIQENMPCQGVTLPLDQETMPSDLYQVLTRGLQADYKDRDLDIHQIRHVFQDIRVNQPYVKAFSKKLYKFRTKLTMKVIGNKTQ